MILKNTVVGARYAKQKGIEFTHLKTKSLLKPHKRHTNKNIKKIYYSGTKSG